jgi:hypothetical protein
VRLSAIATTRHASFLAQAWAATANVYGEADGLLSDLCIHTLVLMIFNAFHAEILTVPRAQLPPCPVPPAHQPASLRARSQPADGLLRVLLFVSLTDWNTHAFTLFGPQPRKLVGQSQPEGTGPLLWPASFWAAPVRPLVTPELLSKYACVEPSDAAPEALPRFAVMDPLRPGVCIGRCGSASKENLVLEAMSSGALRLEQLLRTQAQQKVGEPSVALLLKAIIGTIQHSPPMPQPFARSPVAETRKEPDTMLPPPAAAAASFTLATPGGPLSPGEADVLLGDLVRACVPIVSACWRAVISLGRLCTGRDEYAVGARAAVREARHHRGGPRRAGGGHLEAARLCACGPHGQPAARYHKQPLVAVHDQRCAACARVLRGDRRA